MMKRAIARLADRYQVSPPLMIAGLAVLLMAIVQVSVVAVLFTRSFTASPPLEYGQIEYAPEQRYVCPGDDLRWVPTLTIRSGGHVFFSRTIWDRTTDAPARTVTGAAIPSTQFERDFPDRAIDKSRANNATFLVPDLKPGIYELVTTSWGINTNEARYSVMFIVKSEGAC